MERKIVLLHGLPGAGKSTLARGVSTRLDDLYYADIASSPDFRRKAMYSLFAHLYDRYGEDRSLIIEGVLPKRAYRDSLITKLMDRAAPRQPFDSAIIIHIAVELTILSSRRNRSVAEYEKLAQEMELGSAKFAYVTFHCGEPDKNTSRADIERLAAIITKHSLSGGSKHTV